MNHPGVIEKVRVRAGLQTWEQAERITTHVLRALRPLLRSDERRAMAQRLEPALAEILLGPSPQPDDDVETFFERIARGTHERFGAAVEHGRLVCAILGNELSADVKKRFQRDLPRQIAELFALESSRADSSEVFVPPSNEVHRKSSRPPPPQAPGRTLATGRPGGTRPLSEAAPGSTHPVSESAFDNAQSHSVSREANPHDDRKISSAAGLTQEQLNESLATGKPR